MKIEFFKKIRLFAAVSASVALLNVSCSKVDDLYKSSGPEAEGLLNDVDVSASFDWSTSKVIDVRLAVDDKFEGKYNYRLDIFDRDPQSPGATLLGGGLAKNGQDLITKISVPTGLEYIFLQETTPYGMKSFTMLEIAGKTSVNNTNIVGAPKLAGVNILGVNKMYSVDVVSKSQPIVPNDAVELKSDTKLDWNEINNGKKIFIIKKGYKYTKNFSFLNAGIQGIVVFVEGVWDIDEEVTIGSENKIIVLDGGKVNFKKLSMVSGKPEFINFGNAKFVDSFVVSNDGAVENYKYIESNSFTLSSNSSRFDNFGGVKFTEILLSNSGKFSNKKAGIVNVSNKLTISSDGQFLNEGDAEIKELYAESPKGVITNNGILNVSDKASITNAVFNVNCKTFIESFTSNGAKVNIASGARLNIDEIKSSGGTTFTLQSSAILDVKDGAKFESQANYIVGPSEGQSAVALFGQVEFSNNKALCMSYLGKLLVIDENHPFTIGRVPYVAENGAKVVRAESSAIDLVITATDCNGGGINYKPTTPPVDQKPEAIELGTFSYAFEDNWPVKGDYDMNDLVVDIKIVKYQNKDNKVEKVVLKNKIRAVGASKNLAAAVQFDNVLAGLVKSVSYSNKNLVGQVLPLSGVGIEQGQTKAIVTIVDDAHKAFGRTDNSFIYTHNGTTAPLETEITVEFNSPLDNFTYDDLNVFIINFAQKAGGRHEVHMVGYNPTDKVNAEVIRREQKDGMLSVSDPFKTKRNYPFALRFPVEFQYPLEGQSINKAYPLFTDWVKSAGQSNQFWYNRTK